MGRIAPFFTLNLQKEDFNVVSLQKKMSFRYVVSFSSTGKDLVELMLWSLLLASGYLKVTKMEEKKVPGRPVLYDLRLTNAEVEDMFYNMVQGWFDEASETYNDFVKALLMGDKKAMNVYMNRVALQTFCYFDTGKNPSYEEPERFYHGFVLGLLVDLAEAYVLTSNRESGFGRYDVVIEPKARDKDAFILEFKVRDAEDEKTLEDTVQSALTLLTVFLFFAIVIVN